MRAPSWRGFLLATLPLLALSSGVEAATGTVSAHCLANGVCFSVGLAGTVQVPAGHNVTHVDLGSSSATGFVTNARQFFGGGGAGETVYTAYSGSSGVYHGSTGAVPAPYSPNGTQWSSNYIAAVGTGTAQLAINHPFFTSPYIGFLWGSVEADNTVQIALMSGGYATITGADILAAAPVGSGSHESFYVNIASQTQWFKGTTFYNSAPNSTSVFEVADIEYTREYFPITGTYEYIPVAPPSGQISGAPAPIAGSSPFAGLLAFGMLAGMVGRSRRSTFRARTPFLASA